MSSCWRCPDCGQLVCGENECYHPGCPSMDAYTYEEALAIVQDKQKLLTIKKRAGGTKYDRKALEESIRCAATA